MVRDQILIPTTQGSIPRWKNTVVFTLNNNDVHLNKSNLGKRFKPAILRIQSAAWGTHPILPSAKAWIHSEFKTVNDIILVIQTSNQRMGKPFILQTEKVWIHLKNSQPQNTHNPNILLANG